MPNSLKVTSAEQYKLNEQYCLNSCPRLGGCVIMASLDGVETPDEALVDLQTTCVSINRRVDAVLELAQRHVDTPNIDHIDQT